MAGYNSGAVREDSVAFVQILEGDQRRREDRCLNEEGALAEAQSVQRAMRQDCAWTLTQLGGTTRRALWLEQRSQGEKRKERSEGGDGGRSAGSCGLQGGLGFLPLKVGALEGWGQRRGGP